jgi:hypothetical protein
MFKKLIVLSTIVAMTSFSVGASWSYSDAWEKVISAGDAWDTKGQDLTPDDHWDLSATEWLMFASGLLVGFSE